TLESNNWFLIFAAFTIALALHAGIFGPVAALISAQFGTGSRYIGACLDYHLATLIGAAFTSRTLATLYHLTDVNSVPPLLMYLTGLAIVSAAAILLTRESKDLDLESHEA